jgi:hypothetical protein
VGTTDVGTAVGLLAGIEVGTAVGGLGVGKGGAATTVSELGTQDAVTTLPAIQAYPPGAEGYGMYHHVPSLFLPVTVRVVPGVTEPIMS